MHFLSLLHCTLQAFELFRLGIRPKGSIKMQLIKILKLMLILKSLEIGCNTVYSVFLQTILQQKSLMMFYATIVVRNR